VGVDLGGKQLSPLRLPRGVFSAFSGGLLLVRETNRSGDGHSRHPKLSCDRSHTFSLDVHLGCDTRINFGIRMASVYTDDFAFHGGPEQVVDDTYTLCSDLSAGIVSW
jgi:hypothetical protein